MYLIDFTMSEELSLLALIIRQLKRWPSSSLRNTLFPILHLDDMSLRFHMHISQVKESRVNAKKSPFHLFGGFGV